MADDPTPVQGRVAFSTDPPSAFTVPTPGVRAPGVLAMGKTAPPASPGPPPLDVFIAAKDGAKD